MPTPRRPKKLEPMSIRLDPDVKAALEALATAQERSLSWIANKALRQWVETNKAAIADAERQVGRQAKSPSKS
jgi:predicted transcriptional regulator